MLKTDFKNDVFSGSRKYQMTTNADGTVSFTDVTQYTQVGDEFAAGDINSTNTDVNSVVSSLGGLSFVKCTQSAYDSMASHDSNTVYVIVG